ncbi:hypothetical protein G7Z17_g3702 [Cylindrodendrum hubeiense]|uniref:Uncharacterized protein n=1 Tax=Cylindrodendrum hubeiense TaxID=595255 RepID=A0A9P5HIC0_9HYPO|nr:hypothetical protein G7Z17_g3702 [Cylindrodendrum hubeiense]
MIGLNPNQSTSIRDIPGNVSSLSQLSTTLVSLVNLTGRLTTGKNLLGRANGFSGSQQEHSASQYEITKLQYESLLKRAIENIGVNLPVDPKPCTALTDQILARISVVTPNQTLARAASNVGAVLAINFYPSHNAEMKLLIGLYSAFLTILDDIGDTMADDIGQFRKRLVTREQQPALFELMAELFIEFDRVLPPYLANKVFSGVLSGLASLEVEYDRSAEFTGLASPSFPKYFRNMTGHSEVYAYFLLTSENFTMERLKHFLRAVPEIWNVTDEINDLMSFYKESIVDVERDTYHGDYSTTRAYRADIRGRRVAAKVGT